MKKFQIQYKALSPKSSVWKHIETSYVKSMAEARTRAYSLGWRITLINGYVPTYEDTQL